MNTAGQVPDLTNRLRGSVARVAELEGIVRARDAQLIGQGGRVASLSQQAAALEQVAARVPPLEAQLAQHVDAHREKDEHLEHLMDQVDELEPIVAHVPVLTAQLRELEAAHAEKDARLAALAPLAAQTFDLEEQVNQLRAVHAKTEARLADADYQDQLAARKLHMAEAAITTHANRTAQLQEQISAVQAELENATEVSAPALPMVRAAAAAVGAGTMGAAVGAALREFYDVNHGVAPEPPAPAPDPARDDYENSLNKFQKVEAAKDAEIAKLQGKLTDLEAAPDPDARRQILLTAKNAELTHLRGVLNSLFQPVGREEVARRAFSYAEERGFQGGSPMEDWLRAERDLHFGRLTGAWDSTRTSTMF
jgi:DNA repair exonuclease SbcCD ATPase subunit